MADATENELDEGVTSGGTSTVSVRCGGGARYEVRELRESREDDEVSDMLTGGTTCGVWDEEGEVGEVMAE